MRPVPSLIPHRLFLSRRDHTIPDAATTSPAPFLVITGTKIHTLVFSHYLLSPVGHPCAWTPRWHLIFFLNSTASFPSVRRTVMEPTNQGQVFPVYRLSEELRANKHMKLLRDSVTSSVKWAKGQHPPPPRGISGKPKEFIYIKAPPKP